QLDAEAEAAGHLPHLVGHQLLRRPDALVDRRDDQVLQHLDVGCLEQRGLDADLYQLELAVDDRRHHPAPGARLDGTGADLLLHRRELLLQLLRLPEEPPEVESLAHRPLLSALVAVTDAAYLTAEDLDRRLHQRIRERLLGPAPRARNCSQSRSPDCAFTALGAAGEPAATSPPALPAPSASSRRRISSTGRSGGKVASRSTAISSTSCGSTVRAGAARTSSASSR